MPTKVTVNLPDETVEALKKIAAQRGITVTQALRQAIEGERFLQEEMQKGTKILLEKPDKSIHQVIFK